MEQETVQLILTTKDWFEMAYFITGGPVLATIAAVGLYQLNLMKEQIKSDREIFKINSIRESIKLANEQCNIYLTTIIQKADNLDSLLEKKKMNYVFEKNHIPYTIEKDKIKFENLNEKLKKLAVIINDKEVAKEILSLLNSIESFSNNFTSKVADDDTAYKAVGKTFTDTVERYISLVVLPENSAKTKYYKNIIELFLLWKNRQEQENLEKELQEDIKNLKEKTERIDKSRKEKIKSMGT
ncbi:MAG: hypothetical protein PHF17_08485 [Arcobacteraceae bacterium]|nr:hypothetical protein [Arcobacteraceae bacterium]